MFLWSRYQWRYNNIVDILQNVPILMIPFAISSADTYLLEVSLHFIFKNYHCRCIIINYWLHICFHLFDNCSYESDVTFPQIKIKFFASETLQHAGIRISLPLPLLFCELWMSSERKPRYKIFAKLHSKHKWNSKSNIGKNMSRIW